MKKTLFSIAFLAASGAYVAAANHVFDHLPVPGARPEEAELDPAVKSPAPAMPGSPAQDAAKTPAATSSAVAASTEPRPELLAPARLPQSAPQTTVAAATPPTPATTAKQPEIPPLPRPRPADAPSVQTAQATAGAGTSPYSDGVYTGTDENAYYGRVQIQVTVASGQIHNIKVLDYPSDRRTSRYINSQALPMLTEEVIQAQSANVDIVSGATLTSEAYIRSLSNALRKAGSSNA